MALCECLDFFNLSKIHITLRMDILKKLHNPVNLHLCLCVRVCSCIDGKMSRVWYSDVHFTDTIFLCFLCKCIWYVFNVPSKPRMVYFDFKSSKQLSFKCIHIVILCHYSDVIMSEMASQITSLTIVCLTVYFKENIKAPRHWPLCGECTGDRWIPHTKGQLRGKSLHLMTSSWYVLIFYRSVYRVGKNSTLCAIYMIYTYYIYWLVKIGEFST